MAQTQRQQTANYTNYVNRIPIEQQTATAMKPNNSEQIFFIADLYT